MGGKVIEGCRVSAGSFRTVCFGSSGHHRCEILLSQTAVRFSSLGLYNPRANSIVNQVSKGGKVQFVHDVCAMGFNGFHADIQS